MRKYRLFERTLGLSRTETKSTNGLSPSTPDSLPPSPADDPLDRLARARAELRSVTEDDEDTGQFDVSRAGLKASGVPRWAMGVVGAAVALALLAVAIAWAIAYVKR